MREMLSNSNALNAARSLLLWSHAPKSEIQNVSHDTSERPAGVAASLTWTPVAGVRRVGGHAEAARVENVCRENGIPVWCGGMLESGIGRAHNIAMATRAGFTLPGDVSASLRYWEEDIIEPAVTVTARGTIVAPEKPGIGFEVNVRRLEQVTVRKEAIE